MKSIKVTLEFEMSVPDTWSVLGEDGPDSGLLLVDNERFEPALTWMRITERTADSHTSELVDDETANMLGHYIVQCEETVAEL